jgi:hypothetical protein
MRLLIATDAWRPQVNGVVRSLEYMAAEAPHFGVEVAFLTPERFRSFPMPTYPEIRLSLAGPGRVARIIEEIRPTHLHIATEGPIGLAMRIACGQGGGASPRATTPAFRNMSRPACPSLNPGLTARCGDSTGAPAP